MTQPHKFRNVSPELIQKNIHKGILTKYYINQVSAISWQNSLWFWKRQHGLVPVWHFPPRRSHDEISEICPSRAKVAYDKYYLHYCYNEIDSNVSNINSLITEILEGYFQITYLPFLPCLCRTSNRRKKSFKENYHRKKNDIPWHRFLLVIY